MITLRDKSISIVCWNRTKNRIDKTNWIEWSKKKISQIPNCLLHSIIAKLRTFGFQSTINHFVYKHFRFRFRFISKSFHIRTIGMFARVCVRLCVAARTIHRSKLDILNVQKFKFNFLLFFFFFSRTASILKCKCHFGIHFF